MALSFLELQNIPVKPKDLTCLCEGIAKNNTIRHLSFEGCPIGDLGLTELCQAIRQAPEIATLNLTGCRISSVGVANLTSLIRFQATQRHNAAWKESLRYRNPVLDLLGGLRRITLNDNPALGDAGSIFLAEVLLDDLWVKALDLQACELTDQSARAWLRVLLGNRGNAALKGDSGNENHGNRSLFVLDLRRNPNISRDLLRAVTERALINSEGKQTEFNWLRAGPQAPTHLCSGVVAYPWPGMVSLHTNHSKTTPFANRATMSHGRLQSARCNTRSLESIIANERKEVHQSRQYDRVFSVEKTRSRSLNTHDHHHNRDHSSGPPSVRRVWRPAGVFRPVRQPSSEPAHIDRRIPPQTSNGIPWRAAARASRCCRGYPSHQHPGQTCIEARSLPLDQRFVDGRPNSARRSVPRQRQPECYSSRSTPRPSRMPIAPSRQAPRDLLPQQLRKIMLRVSDLESQLTKQNDMADDRLVQKHMNDQRNAGDELEQIDSDTVMRLNEFIVQLKPLVEQVRKVPLHSTPVARGDVEQLQHNLQTLSDLIGEFSGNVNHQKAKPKQQRQIHPPHNYSNATRTRTVLNRRQLTYHHPSSDKNREQRQGPVNNGSRLRTIRPNNQTKITRASGNPREDPKSQMRWETYAKTRAVQTDGDEEEEEGDEEEVAVQTSLMEDPPQQLNSIRSDQVELQLNNHAAILGHHRARLTPVVDTSESSTRLNDQGHLQTNQSYSRASGISILSADGTKWRTTSSKSDGNGRRGAESRELSRLQLSPDSVQSSKSHNVDPAMKHGAYSTRYDATGDGREDNDCNASDNDEESIISDEEESIQLWSARHQHNPNGSHTIQNNQQTESRSNFSAASSQLRMRNSTREDIIQSESEEELNDLLLGEGYPNVDRKDGDSSSINSIDLDYEVTMTQLQSRNSTYMTQSSNAHTVAL